MSIADLYRDDTPERRRRAGITAAGLGVAEEGITDDPRENDAAKKALDETYRATGQEHLASDYVPPDAKSYADAPSFTLPVGPDRSAPQGTMPTAQEQDVPTGPGRLQQTATVLSESAPGRFLRSAAAATPKTLENVGTVAGMMVGGPLIAQGAKALPKIAASAAGAVAQAARNPAAAVRERPLAGPIGALGAEVAFVGDKANPVEGGPAGSLLAGPGPVSALKRKGFSIGAVPERPGGVRLGSGLGGFDPNAGTANTMDPEIAALFRGGKSSAPQIEPEVVTAISRFYNIDAKRAKEIADAEPEFVARVRRELQLLGKPASKPLATELPALGRSDAGRQVRKSSTMLWEMPDPEDMKTVRDGNYLVKRSVVYMTPEEAMAKAPDWQRIDKTGQGQSAIPSRVTRASEHVDRGGLMSPPTIVQDVDGSTSFRDGRHRTVLAWQRGDEKIPVVLETHSTRKAGERGAAGFGLIVDPVRRLAKKGIKATDDFINTNPLVGELRKGVHFVEDKVSEYGVGAVSPKLKKFMSSAPTVELDRFRSMTHSKQNSYLLTAQERGVAETSDITKDEYGPITEYLRTSNFKARLDSGIEKLPKGMTPADVDMALMDSSSNLSPQRLRELEGKYRAWTGSIGDRAEAIGILEKGQRRLDYMPHLVRKFFEDEPQVSSAAVGSLFTKPGFTKKAVGSMAEIESDPYKAAVFVDYMTGRAEAMSEFFDEVGRHSLNADLRAGTAAFDPEKHALFSFSPSGRSQVSTGARAENELKALMSREVGPGGVAVPVDPHSPFPPDPSAARQIKGYFVVPKELAEGASEYDTNANRLATGVFGKAVAKTLDVTASIARDMQLVWSLPFQAGQWPADLSTVLHNVPESKIPGVIKDFGENVSMLMSEYAKIRGGGKSDSLAQLRKDGYLTDIATSLVDDSHGGVIAEHAIAKQHRAQPQGIFARLQEGYRNAKEPLTELGQVREGAAKLALGKAFSEMGLDPKAAVYLANDRTGGYYHRSAWGKLASKLVLNSKWYSTQVERLTRDIAKNVRTGRSDLTGLLEGPAKKIAASQLLIYAANHRDEKTTAAYDRLPLYKKGSLIIYVDEDGDAITATPDTLGTLATSIYETARGFDADPLDTVAQLSEAASGRANPLVKMANAAFNPRSDPREEQGMNDEDLRSLNWKQFGLPGLTPKQQRVLVSPFTGWPGRVTSDILSRDMSAPDKITRVLSDLALPVPGMRLNRVRRDAGMAQLMAMNSDKLKSAIINAANGETEEDAAQLEKLTEVYFQGGFGTEADWMRLITGAEIKADEAENLNSDERKDMTRARLGELDPEQFEALKYKLSDLYK